MLHVIESVETVNLQQNRQDAYRLYHVSFHASTYVAFCEVPTQQYDVTRRLSYNYFLYLFII